MDGYGLIPVNHTCLLIVHPYPMINPCLSHDYLVMTPLSRVFSTPLGTADPSTPNKDGADRADPTHNAVSELPSEEVEELRGHKAGEASHWVTL